MCMALKTGVIRRSILTLGYLVDNMGYPLDYTELIWGSKLTGRPRQKQLHVWISDELKTQLDEWRDARNSTFTNVISEALTAHFEQPTSTEIGERLARLERKTDLILSHIGHQVAAEKPLPRARQTTPNRESAAVRAAEDDSPSRLSRPTQRRRRSIRRGTHNDNSGDKQ